MPWKSVSDKTIRDYLLMLHKLIYNCYRCYLGQWNTPYSYPPLHESQLLRLKELSNGLADPNAPHLDLFHRFCFAILAHKRHEYPSSKDLSWFFSPVNCAIVLCSVTQNGALVKASNLSHNIAGFMYSMCACIAYQIKVEYDSSIDIFKWVFRHVFYLGLDFFI